MVPQPSGLAPPTLASRQDPRPHASFAWAPGDHAAALSAALLAAAPQEAAPLDVPVAQVVARVGQREHAVWSAPLA